MVGEFSIFHWVVVFGVLILFFGPKRIPELAKGLGQGIRDFKKALNGEEGVQKPQITADDQKAIPSQKA